MDATGKVPFLASLQKPSQLQWWRGPSLLCPPAQPVIRQARVNACLSVCMCVFLCIYPGDASSCNFWTSIINRIFYFIIGILRLRAINWYINEFNRRGSGGGGGSGGFRLFGTPPPEFYWGISQNYKYIFGILRSNPFDWHPF